MKDITLKESTIGHLKVLQKLNFDKLDSKDVDTLLKYIVIFSVDVDTLRVMDVDTLNDMADRLAYEIPTSAEYIEQLSTKVENHIKATHDKEFETRQER